MVHLDRLGAEQFHGTGDVDGVVEDELVGRAALDLWWGGREREAGQVALDTKR